MDELIQVCNESRNYPQNLSNSEHLEYVLSSYFQKLNDHQLRLFSNEQDSEVICRDLDHAGLSTGGTTRLIHETTNSVSLAFWNTTLRTAASLKSHLGLEPRAKTLDPRCRFM